MLEKYRAKCRSDKYRCQARVTTCQDSTRANSFENACDLMEVEVDKGGLVKAPSSLRPQQGLSQLFRFH